LSTLPEPTLPVSRCRNKKHAISMPFKPMQLSTTTLPCSPQWFLCNIPTFTMKTLLHLSIKSKSTLLNWSLKDFALSFAWYSRKRHSTFRHTRAVFPSQLGLESRKKIHVCAKYSGYLQILKCQYMYSCKC
jgi:hypothetical protein